MHSVRDGVCGGGRLLAAVYIEQHRTHSASMALLTFPSGEARCDMR